MSPSIQTPQPSYQRDHVARHVQTLPVAAPAAVVTVAAPVKQASPGERLNHHHHYHRHRQCHHDHHPQQHHQYTESQAEDRFYHPNVLQPSPSDFNSRTAAHKALPPPPPRENVAAAPVAWPCDSGPRNPANTFIIMRDDRPPPAHKRSRSSLANASSIESLIERREAVAVPLLGVAVTTATDNTEMPYTSATSIAGHAPAGPAPASAVPVVPIAPAPPVLPVPPIPATAPPATASRQEKAHGNKSSSHRRTSSFQTRYMDMLREVDKIPRMHNILAALFTWILLAGFVIIPGSFTSSPASAAGPDSNDRQQQNPPTPGGFLFLGTPPFLHLASALTGAGAAGMLWLGLRWRRNYVWLLNRVYLPGALNGLAGVAATLTAVYSQQQQQEGGRWSATALAAIAVEAAVCLVCGSLFVLYNNLLLWRVRRQHGVEQGAEGGGGGGHRRRTARRRKRNTLLMRFYRMSKSPPFAPGSVV